MSAALLETLTKGAISDIINGKDIVEPMVQIVMYKCLKAQGVEKYRLILSDGVHSHSSCIINSSYNSKISSGEIDPHCVVQLKRYTTSMQSGKCIIIINEIEVMNKGSDVKELLGEPTSFKIAESQNVNPSADADSSRNNSPKKSKMDQSAIARYNKGVDSPSKKVHPINSLTPYQNRWCIRGRISSKGALKTYSNSKGSGKLFNFVVIDESGEIRCTAYNDECDRIFESIEVGKIYQISKCQIKPANRQYSNINNDYEMVVNTDSLFLPQEDDSSIPKVDFNFTKIEKIAEVNPNSVIDVVGCIIECGELSNLTSKKGKELTKRDIEMCDDSGYKIRITLWGELAASVDADKAKSLAVKNCRVSDYNGRSLSTTLDGQLLINPDIKEAYTILGWYDRVKDNLELKDFRDIQGLRSETSGPEILNLSQVRKNNSEGLDQARYATVLGHLAHVKCRDNGIYKGCSSCKKKLQTTEDGSLFCDKCRKAPEDFNWNLILSVEIVDCVDAIWATSFLESSETLVGHTASELGQIKENNQENNAVDIDTLLVKNLFEPYLFKLKSVSEIYNDEQKIKTTIMGVMPYNPVAYGYKLIQQIKAMEV